jgi:exo-beta-1,3-glucanase (GH17 family)
MSRTLLAVAFAVLLAAPACAAEPDKRFPLFAYLTGSPSPSMVAYSPSELDPRQDVNNRQLATSSIRADLVALRPAFDGLVLYGYHEATTPRIVALARELRFRSVVLGIWDPKSTAELDGVAALAKLYENELAIGVIVGNEGVTFGRYEAEDLPIAAARLRSALPKTIPLATSEPLHQYQQPFAREFGDFLAPNVHPVFDRKELVPADAAAWARAEAARIARAANKPVLLKETGMPHLGTREGVKYSPQTQAAFWEAYLKPGKLAGQGGGPWVFHGVAFEAFDLPWKVVESKLEIEAGWGLLDAKRKPHPAFDVWKGAVGK